MGRNHIFGLGLLAAAATTVPAYAQPANAPSAASTMATDYPVCTKKATESDVDLAKQKFIAARQDYEEANYDSALRRFKGAYDLDCSKPELLLIISATHERRGDKPAALAALELYVQRAPKDAPEMATTQAKIENLKKQTTTAPPPTASTSAPPSGDMQEHTIYPWIAVGVGAAVVVTGVIFLVTTPTKPPNCSIVGTICTRTAGENDDQLAQDRSDAGNSVGQPKIGTGLLIGGGVILVGGLIWHFLEPTGPKSASSKRKLTPSVSPGFAGLSYGGSF